MEFLQDSGIDIRLFGHGSAKPLKAFLQEVVTGKCCLKRDVATNAIQREITVVNVKLMPRTQHTLLVESTRTMPNGTVKVT
jgi:hypothetical protein